MVQGKDIILISNQMLDDRYWTSKQYITMELIKNNRVLYVEANYSFGKLLSGMIGKKWPVVPFGRLQYENDNLSVLTPYPRLPYRNHFQWIGWLNQKLLLAKIRRATKKLNFVHPLLWTFLHQTANMIGKLDESVAIYHCVDDWSVLLPMAGMGEPKRIRKDEKKLISCVDVVFRVSAKLLDYYKIPNTKVFDISNGVDIDLFNPERYLDESLHDDMKNLPRPIIGFSGSFGKWIDVELLIQVSRRYEEVSIVIIGLNEKNPNIHKLKPLENVHFLGMKSRKKVPQYISGFDVCLMPFNHTEVGKGLLPLKMFEYLALGKPVVAISSEVLEQFEEVLYLADDNDAFVQEIENAMVHDDRKNLVSRREWALKYSWKNRVSKYLNIIQRSINNKMG
ncbi:MAG: glycosyltransferase [Candidatus Marinimicrobia bacterium]|nr:glycosyltransferase [Candidatus Neomarinimicrobiota bacterium]